MWGRLIPARAGKTLIPPYTSSRATAHPRACGENYWNVIADPIEKGSSPRVRGKLQLIMKL